MKRTLKALIFVLALLLIAELAFVYHMETRETVPAIQIPPVTQAPTVPETTVAPTTVPPTTVPPTTVPPEPEYFTLTFTGDFTPGCKPGQEKDSRSYIGTVGDDYEYPFAHLRETFEADDFTFINLEVVLGQGIGKAASKAFVFVAPEEYVHIMSTSSVEAVTLANNHTQDFGKEGYDNTKRVLDENGIDYVEAKNTLLYTTERGLTIGIYADYTKLSTEHIAQSIAALREQGAEVVICALHWGAEGSYRYDSDQEYVAHAAIDAGADMVVGHHPHRLQAIEEYNGGIICYSLGNFSFGGNKNPEDKDSAVVQQQIIRQSDGTITLGELTIIPISISSDPDRNNYQPIPYEEGTAEYQRVLDKLNGSFAGPNYIPSYW